MKPKELMKLLTGSYTSTQITKCKWYIKNRESELQRQHEYRKTSNYKESQKKWRESNIEYNKERNARWRKANRDYDLSRRVTYRQKLKRKYNIPNRFGGKTQKLIQGYAEEFYSMKCISEYRFDWLISDKGYVMPVDMYFPELNLIIEYNGQQHYFPVDFGCGEEIACARYEAQRRRDKLKYKLIEKHGFNLLIVPYSYSKSWLQSELSKFL